MRPNFGDILDKALHAYKYSEATDEQLMLVWAYKLGRREIIERLVGDDSDQDNKSVQSLRSN